jgi:Tol biopolymer transport system component
VPAITSFPYDSMGQGTFWIGKGSVNYIIDTRARTFTTNDVGFWYPRRMSPDSKLVVAIGLGNNLNSTVYVSDWTGKSTALTDDSQTKRYPSWSFDGSSVFFLKSQSVGFTIERITIATRIVTSIDPGIERPCAFSDGTGSITESADGTIAYLARTPSGDSCTSPHLFLIRPDGTHKKFLGAPPSRGTLFSPVWSPDGRTIAYGVSVAEDLTTSKYSTTMRLMNPDTGSAIDVVTVVSHISKVRSVDTDPICWSSDGSRILFNVFDDVAENRVYSVRPNGTGLTEIASGYLLSCSR